MHAAVRSSGESPADFPVLHSVLSLNSPSYPSLSPDAERDELRKDLEEVCMQQAAAAQRRGAPLGFTLGAATTAASATDSARDSSGSGTSSSTRVSEDGALIRALQENQAKIKEAQQRYAPRLSFATAKQLVGMYPVGGPRSTHRVQTEYSGGTPGLEVAARLSVSSHFFIVLLHAEQVAERCSTSGLVLTGSVCA